MNFEQVDGSLRGGCAHNVPNGATETEGRKPQENIRFIVSPKMAETMILRLAWLKKWNPVVNRKSNKWYLRSKAGELQRVGTMHKVDKISLVGKGKTLMH